MELWELQRLPWSNFLRLLEDTVHPPSDEGYGLIRKNLLLGPEPSILAAL